MWVCERATWRLTNVWVCQRGDLRMCRFVNVEIDEYVGL